MVDITGTTIKKSCHQHNKKIEDDWTKTTTVTQTHLSIEKHYSAFASPGQVVVFVPDLFNNMVHLPGTINSTKKISYAYTFF